MGPVSSCQKDAVTFDSRILWFSSYMLQCIFLPRDQHVVFVDMPGHEGTSRTGTEDYSIQGQASRIHQFVQSVGRNKRPFQPVGTSMGGNVAGVYAARYSSALSSLTLVCPAGKLREDLIYSRRLRELEKSRTGRHAETLLPQTPQPPPVLRGLLANRMPNNDFYKEDIYCCQSFHNNSEKSHNRFFK
uniref:AB hydrolase-1 domain-containing protein n=1 Tax=Nothobranchius furzeri TaxID=105023 RepID=A0A8C6LJB8_NOTFU